MTIKRAEMRAQTGKVQTPINAAQEMIGRNVIFEVESVEQAALITAVLSHHQEVLPNTTWIASLSAKHGTLMTFFNRIGRECPVDVPHPPPESCLRRGIGWSHFRRAAETQRIIALP